jgi:trimeric autotransporter adhesin
MKLSNRVLLSSSLAAVCFSAHAQTLKVTTVAGGHSGNGVPATSAAIAGPVSVARDSEGNLYVSDSGNCRIRKINKKGAIDIFVGTSICGYSGDGGPAYRATLANPGGIAFDAHGNLLVADSGNSVVRKVTRNGIITTIAGNGTGGYSGDGGPASQAALNFPTSVSSDPTGNVYISDNNNTVIRMIDPSGNIHTVAGNHVGGFSGDGGPATSAELACPLAVLADGNGNFYIADTNNYRVRKVDSTGTITTFAGNGSYQVSGDGGPATSAGLGPVNSLLLLGNKLYIATQSRIWAVDMATQLINIVAGSSVFGFNGDGMPALSTLIGFPRGMASDPEGDIFVAELINERVRKIDTSQTVTTVAGGYIGDGRPGPGAALNNPWHIAFDPAGNLYIAEYGGNRVRKVSTDGTISTFAGTGITGYSGDGGPANLATLAAPEAVAADAAGDVFIADTAFSNGHIRKVDPSGTITTFSNIAAVALAIDGMGNVYASDFNVIWKITPAGSATIVAGKQFCYGYGGDGGPAAQACLFLPTGVAVDNSGNLYIADWLNQRVRKVDTSGIISTFAGNGNSGFAGDGGSAIAAQLFQPQDVAVDGTGNVYISDSINARVRVVDGSGTIHTYAGNGNFEYNGNNLPAIGTAMSPYGLAVDSKGVVYVDDIESGRVRKIH